MAGVTYDAGADRGEIEVEVVGGRLRDVFQFQHGPMEAGKPNGLLNEQVLEMMIMRVRALQERLPCRENALAITKLEEALMWLGMRTANRAAQGVEGTEEPHAP